MRNILLYATCTLLLCTGCTHQIPSKTIAAMSAEFHAPTVVVDTDCIFSAPRPNEYKAYRISGLCMFSDTQLRLYYGGKDPSLAYTWQLAAIKSWVLHNDTFTLVTEAGNVGLVIKDADTFAAELRKHGVPENDKLPLYRAKDPSPFLWM